MEKVVYILGAGFSAPLGLPVMSNFYEKSKDQYHKHPDQFSHLGDVFRYVDDLDRTLKYYNTDLFNIEDILSILEFRSRFSSRSSGNEITQFRRYIKDVIAFYTPPFQDKDTSFIGSGKWTPYKVFVAALLRGCLFDTEQHGFAGYDVPYIFQSSDMSEIEYSIVTLNYDLVLEACEQHFKRFGSPRYFCRTAEKDPNGVYIAKLHGSIDTEDIIAPTWNKGLGQSKLTDWEVAYKVLSEANHIRILGYSLPITDTYIKYLLRAAVIESPHLKRIDVICLDNDGRTQERYKDLIRFHNYRFKVLNIETYLKYHVNKYSFRKNKETFDRLEEAHSDIFNTSDAELKRLVV